MKGKVICRPTLSTLPLMSHQNSMKQINCRANTTNDKENCTEVHATCINFEEAKIIFAVQEL